MSLDPFKKEQHLLTKLDEYHVNIPDFSMKTKRWDRFIDILASPAKNPFESFISTTNGFMMLKIAPIMGAVVLGLIQFLLFL
ncbi:hypothetical protein [Bacillus sp. 03113]|uniref:hypothetical protein n=1 Tax=Bacillus sp. 03113 TaxID=2578211 RepID=UPI0011419D69|nr:hypothetical protein [Bacillus sp. 03113]